MPRPDPRLWFPLAFLAAGSLLTIAVLLLPKLGKPRPTEPDPQAPGLVVVDGTPMGDNRPDLPPWLKTASLSGAIAQKTSRAFTSFPPRHPASCTSSPTPPMWRG
jgi:hypothetical protein